MKKRDFIKTGLTGAACIVSTPLFGKIASDTSAQKVFSLPSLPYNLNAFTPHFSTEWLTELYKHHQELNTKFNVTYKRMGTTLPLVRDILRQSEKFPASFIALSSEYLNYKLFWRSITPNAGVTPGIPLENSIKRSFGSIDAMKKAFADTAKKHPTADWLWLTISNKQLAVVSTASNQNPFMSTLPTQQQGHPLLAVKLSNHNKRSREECLESFWQVANWETANKRLINRI